MRAQIEETAPVGFPLRTRVYPFGPVWSGIGLWHEFSHVNDYSRGDLPVRANTAEMDQGTEGRAYPLETIAIDVMTRGTEPPRD
ncbi:hypothetical protein [Humibacillus xanthopallidus]|uniref:hypothetical protein n=1 Tax=Humibacillus xanthopallidus TaxID=412689 RepID=UPI00115384BC|nr:hypothetical protein [Humibacillus xanthopallidus]